MAVMPQDWEGNVGRASRTGATHGLNAYVTDMITVSTLLTGHGTLPLSVIHHVTCLIKYWRTRRHAVEYVYRHHTVVAGEQQVR